MGGVKGAWVVGYVVAVLAGVVGGSRLQPRQLILEHDLVNLLNNPEGAKDVSYALKDDRGTEMMGLSVLDFEDPAAEKGAVSRYRYVGVYTDLYDDLFVAVSDDLMNWMYVNKLGGSLTERILSAKIERTRFEGQPSDQVTRILLMTTSDTTNTVHYSVLESAFDLIDNVVSYSFDMTDGPPLRKPAIYDLGLTLKGPSLAISAAIGAVKSGPSMEHDVTSTYDMLYAPCVKDSLVAKSAAFYTTQLRNLVAERNGNNESSSEPSIMASEHISVRNGRYTLQAVDGMLYLYTHSKGEVTPDGTGTFTRVRPRVSSGEGGLLSAIPTKQSSTSTTPPSALSPRRCSARGPTS